MTVFLINVLWVFNFVESLDFSFLFLLLTMWVPLSSLRHSLTIIVPVKKCGL